MLEEELQRTPGHPVALSQLGLVYGYMGDFDQAAVYMRRSLQLQPHIATTWKNLAGVLIRSGKLYEGFEVVASHFNRTILQPQLVSPRSSVLDLPACAKSRLRHDIEQLDLLLHRRKGDKQVLSRHRDALIHVLRAADNQDTDVAVDKMGQRLGDSIDERAAQDYFELTAEGLMMLAPGINKALYFDPPAPVDGSPFSSAVDFVDAERRYFASSPPITVIDGIFTDEVLHKLITFAEEATVWSSMKKRGYLCSYFENGWSAPLLAQITREFSRVLPSILCNHSIAMLWGYKYDDSGSDGIGIHADEAAVNVNCWITSDDANLDPASGGMVVWKTRPPAHWSRGEYNNENKLNEFKAQLHAKRDTDATTIAYRQNRCVLFDSSLFHTTDTIHFNKGYRNRRINLTFLYGRMFETCEAAKNRQLDPVHWGAGQSTVGWAWA